MKNHLTRKVGFEGTPKIWPVLEVTTSYLQDEYGVEIRIKSTNKDDSHSWVRISHGLNKLVTIVSNKDQYDNNEQEAFEMQFEEYALKLNASAFPSRSKAKAKPQRSDSASSSTRTKPIGRRTWTDVEQKEFSLSDYPVSKNLRTLLRHGSLPREKWSDRVLENKDYLQEYFMYCHHWSDEKWRSSMAGGAVQHTELCFWLRLQKQQGEREIKRESSTTSTQF